MRSRSFELTAYVGKSNESCGRVRRSLIRTAGAGPGQRGAARGGAWGGVRWGVGRRAEGRGEERRGRGGQLVTCLSGTWCGSTSWSLRQPLALEVGRVVAWRGAVKRGDSSPSGAWRRGRAGPGHDMATYYTVHGRRPKIVALTTIMLSWLWRRSCSLGCCAVQTVPVTATRPPYPPSRHRGQSQESGTGGLGASDARGCRPRQQVEFEPCLPPLGCTPLRRLMLNRFHQRGVGKLTPLEFELEEYALVVWFLRDVGRYGQHSALLLPPLSEMALKQKWLSMKLPSDSDHPLFTIHYLCYRLVSEVLACCRAALLASHLQVFRLPAWNG